MAGFSDSDRLAYEFKKQYDSSVKTDNSTLQDFDGLDLATINTPTNAGLIEYDTNSEYKDGTVGSQLSDLVSQLLPYGVEFDTTVSSPTCTRIGNMDRHKSLPVQSKMRGCLLDDDGNVIKYLNSEDWTNETRDGSKGQVMVEIPTHYRKCETEGTKRRVYISDSPFVGAHKIPKMYVSAYQATLDRSTSTYKLASVANTTAAFRGGDNKADWDGTYRSLLGLPSTMVSLTQFRAYARNRNAAATSEWNCMTYDAQKAIYWLFVVEYATLNSQADYNAQPATGGYRQGGLGMGVTDWNGTEWATYNSQNPLIPCGTTDSLGNGTGVVSYKVANDDGSLSHTFNVPRYRGIENPFGHFHQWTDGINVEIISYPTTGNTFSGVLHFYVCSDPSKFADNTSSSYTYVGESSYNGGYTKEVIFGEGGEIMPKVSGGSSSTYFCDVCFGFSTVNRGSTPQTFWHCVRLGGGVYHGMYAGLVFSNVDCVSSEASVSIGSRLCFHPKDI